MANRVVASGLGFFFWTVVARYCTPYEVGLAAAVIPYFTRTLHVLN